MTKKGITDNTYNSIVRIVRFTNNCPDCSCTIVLEYDWHSIFTLWRNSITKTECPECHVTFLVNFDTVKLFTDTVASHYN